MLKLYIVVRVYLLLRKRQKISAIRLVRTRLGEYYGVYALRDAKRFVDDVDHWMWPTTYQ